jgi:hypothetical protein
VAPMARCVAQGACDRFCANLPVGLALSTNGGVVDEIAGRWGELIDRLIKLLNSDGLGPDEWYSIATSATVFLG